MYNEVAAPGRSYCDGEFLVSTSSGVARPPAESRLRLRRRGPRSQAALLRRRTANDASRSSRGGAAVRAAEVRLRGDDFLPATLDDRESTSSGVVPSGFTFLLANIQGFMSKTAELAYLVERSNFPTYIAFTETFLDKAKSPNLHGYVQVSRLDRRTGEKQGGIILYAKEGFEKNIVHVGDSEVHERAWYIIHSDRGPVLFGLQYRRPNKGEIESIESLYDEIAKYDDQAIYTILMGDFNVHEASWLRFSDGTTKEGQALHAFANICGFDEKVGAPTRGDYLLDLVLSDLGSDLKCKVVDGVSDHDAVLGTVAFRVPTIHNIQREYFDYKRAPWDFIHDDLANIPWDDLFSTNTCDDAARLFEERITDVMRRRICCRKSRERVSTHPWLNDRCRNAIATKLEARGTEREVFERDRCSQILCDEYDAHVARTKRELNDLPSSSKKWWKLSNALQGKSSASSSVQSLQRTDKSWARTANERAELLADTFLHKSSLPQATTNEYATLNPENVGDDGFLPVRTRNVERALRKLRQDSATGPDGIATIFLKRCASDLARPLTLLIRKMLRCGIWPAIWRFHRIVPLYKRKARSNPDNYRGVHLTAQLSKVVERVVGKLFLGKLQRDGAFGDRQFAYSVGRGHRDALALSVLSWLQSLECGYLVGLYCSDVSGAFDRVSEIRLGDKLRRIGLHPQILRLLLSWLEPRSSTVVVDGQSSSTRALKNSVYQGTVWGPPLWNIQYSDAGDAVQNVGYLEVIFADDLNCSRNFATGTKKAIIEESLTQCQSELHAWGAANQVLFDAGKESFHCIHRGRHFGDDFKILGVLFDCQLSMASASREISREAGWRLKSLLRCRRFYSVNQLVFLYKAQILSFIESRTPAIHHAAPSVLDIIDRVQRRFLREIDVSEFEGFRRFNLAPLPVRRDISMLGLLYRIAHGLAPSSLSALFPRQVSRHFATRGAKHDVSFVDYIGHGGHTDYFRRSCFGLVTVWNMLPVDVARAKTVKICQRRLQEACFIWASRNQEVDWSHFFSTQARTMPLYLFQRLFR